VNNVQETAAMIAKARSKLETHALTIKMHDMKTLFQEHIMQLFMRFPQYFFHAG
jgi:hypothetical protein